MPTELWPALAPLDEPGFAPAHLWMAQALLITPQLIRLDQRLSPQDRPRLIRYHFEAVLREMPDNPAALQLKARILETESPDQALAIYQRLAENDPRLLMKVASILQAMGQDEASDQVLEGYLALLDESFQQRPILVGGYIDYVTCCTMRREFERTLQFIAEYAVDVRREVANELRANVLVAWAKDTYAQDPEGQLSDVLIRLTQALRLQPNQPQAYELLNELVQGSARASLANQKDLRGSNRRGNQLGNGAADSRQLAFGRRRLRTSRADAASCAQP